MNSGTPISAVDELPPLIGDPDSEFIRTLLSNHQASSVEPIVATNVEEVERALNNPSQNYSGIFINPKIADPFGIPILSQARSLRPTTPIFFLRDDDKQVLPEIELRKLTVARSLLKPINYQDIAHAIRQAQLTFDARIAFQHAAADGAPVGATTTALERDFVPILSSAFVPGSISYFDIYVKLLAGKFVKVLKAGDAFQADRLTTYLNKGVTYFFLKKEAQEQYLRYCEKLSIAVLNAPNISQEIKTTLILNQGQEALSYLKHAGLSPATLAYATKFAENVKELIRSLRLDRNHAVSEFMKNVAMVDHGVATSMVAALLATPLKFEADRGVSIIGMSAMFHDIGLLGAPSKLVAEDEEGLNAEELAEYHLHPKRGADKLAEMKELNPTVVQAVAQHHERRNRRGFPDRLGSGSINMIAEIIGISEEFVHLIGQNAKDPKVDPLRRMELHVFDGFSTSVIAAFRNVFPKIM